MPVRRIGIGLLVLIPALSCGCTPPRTPPHQVREANARAEHAVLRPVPEAPDEPLTLEMVLRIALNNNPRILSARARWRHRLEEMAVRRSSLLPSLEATFERTRRSQPDATGDEADDPDLHVERAHSSFEAASTWSLLDFGIGYMRLTQDRARLDIQRESLRQIRNEVALDVVEQYWTAQINRALSERAEPAADRLDEMENALQNQVESKAIPEIDGLRRQARLQSIRLDLLQYRERYEESRNALLRLMGVHVATEVTIEPADLDDLPEPLELDPEKLEGMALRSRPELFAKDREQEILLQEARIAIASMLPNPSFLWSYHATSNRYQVHPEWRSIGARAAWDLLRIPQRLRERRSAEARVELVRRQRVSLAVGILAQIHVCLLDHHRKRERLALSRTAGTTHERLLAALAQTPREDWAFRQDVLEQRLETLRMKARQYGFYGDLQMARARLWHALGMPADQVADATTRPPSQWFRYGPADAPDRRRPRYDLPDWAVDTLPRPPAHQAGRPERPVLPFETLPLLHPYTRANGPSDQARCTTTAAE